MEDLSEKLLLNPGNKAAAELAALAGVVTKDDVAERLKLQRAADDAEVELSATWRVGTSPRSSTEETRPAVTF